MSELHKLYWNPIKVPFDHQTNGSDMTFAVLIADNYLHLLSSAALRRRSSSRLA
jgi:hypothetical protein